MSLMPLRCIITDLCFNHTLFALHHVLSCKDKGVQIVDALRDVSFCLNAHLISPIDYKNGFTFIHKPDLSVHLMDRAYQGMCVHAPIQIRILIIS